MATKLDSAPLIEAGGGGTRRVARRLGIDPAVLCRPLSIDQADRYAIKLGLHPTDVWGQAVFWADDD
jgi:hypothetical protein